ncbi:Uncharacterized protein BP5553_02499 [Venustampulla echinocandica]|uniref:NACHT domain-containing protein n=1 Tax=Venustampulla echinocandica TaxID=2656787 RepID=A0A370U411_9HELO|nr:Uncharacterized protein BP5553_02499 [Venustampulla echinocandica]RDL42520.1 Uncharacterized protein BP5553_02499 [Venustampulla echinocandica]
MAEIGLAASIIAVIQITTVVATNVVKYGQSVKKAKQDVAKIQAELGDVEQILQKLKDLVNQATTGAEKPVDSWPSLNSLSSPDGALEQCKLALSALSAKLTPVEGFAKYRHRALWPSKKKDVERCLEDIRTHKSKLFELLNAEHMGQSLETGRMVSDISKSLSDDKRNGIIRWLSQADPGNNQIAARKKHQDQTGKWFTEGEEYLQWKQDPDSFLWLYGIPGCGKTILCSEIIEQTREYCANQSADRVLAYFYFSFRDTEKQKVDNLLCSILSQLARQEEYIPDAVITLYNSYMQSRPPTDRLLAAIKNMVDGHRTVFIIIDALDECPNDNGERSDLCDVLRQINEWAASNLHVLVTGRREVDLSEALDPLCSIPPISIQGAAVRSDIQKFICAELANDRKLKMWPAEIQAEIERVLVEGANGMFRWVDCQLDSLKKCITPDDVGKALKSLPRTLDDTYERILMSIPEEHQQKALVALQWISHTCEPITIEQLTEAVIIDPTAETAFDPRNRIPDPSWLIEILSGLVIESTTYRTNVFLFSEQAWGELSFIEIAHFSVKEYVNSVRIRSGPAHTFYISEADAIEAIVQRSLLYITCYSVSDRKSASSKDLNEFPLLGYAALWYWHLRAAEAISTRANDLICNFLDSEVLVSWILIHNPDNELTFSLNTFKIGSPLYYATLFGNSYLLRYIISKGADVNARSGALGTALQAAAYYGNTAAYRGNSDIVKALLDAGADGGRHGSALQAAAAAFDGSTDVVKALLDAGADVNAQGGEYGTALQVALEPRRPMYQDRNQEIAKLLLAAGSDINLLKDNELAKIGEIREST